MEQLEIKRGWRQDLFIYFFCHERILSNITEYDEHNLHIIILYSKWNAETSYDVGLFAGIAGKQSYKGGRVILIHDVAHFYWELGQEYSI